MIKKFLLIQTASIGDVILSSPVLEKLHDVNPDARIDILVKKGMEVLFRGHPFIGKVLTWDKSHSKYLHLFRIAKAIRKEKYDLLVNIQRFASTGLLTAFSRAKVTSGFDKNPFSFAFTYKHPHNIGDGTHESERNLSLIDHLPGKESYPVKLYPSKEDEESVLPLVQDSFITVAPASLWFTKQYPVDKWIEFIREVPKNFKIYLLGSANDDEICNRIIQQADHPGAVNLAGKLDLIRTAALMKKAVMNFVNDSAPQHLASAVNAPVTSVFCSTVVAFGFGPLSTDSAVVETTHELDCRPCGLHGFRECPEGHFKCAWSIHKEQLLKRL